MQKTVYLSSLNTALSRLIFPPPNEKRANTKVPTSRVTLYQLI
ncbi:hypothetical protein [Campylobacter iguaniorum]|nr:hypothetical protein [Campylobacter iguaniorum]